jgi:hypothetical protein
MISPRIFAGALAALATPGLLFTLAMPFFHKEKLPRGFRMPGVAIELAKDPGELQQIASEPGSKTRKKIHSGVTFDFLVIAFYWLFYMSLCAALAERPSWWAIWLAAAAALAVTGAALFDGLENFRVFALLDLPTPAPEVPARLADLTAATLRKWGLLFSALFLLAPTFITEKPSREWVVGALQTAAAAVGLWGVWKKSPAIEWGFALLVLGIIAVAVVWFPKASGRS